MDVCVCVYVHISVDKLAEAKWRQSAATLSDEFIVVIGIGRLSFKIVAGPLTCSLSTAHIHIYTQFCFLFSCHPCSFGWLSLLLLFSQWFYWQTISFSLLLVAGIVVVIASCSDKIGSQAPRLTSAHDVPTLYQWGLINENMRFIWASVKLKSVGFFFVFVFAVIDREVISRYEQYREKKALAVLCDRTMTIANVI